MEQAFSEFQQKIEEYNQNVDGYSGEEKRYQNLFSRLYQTEEEQENFSQYRQDLRDATDAGSLLGIEDAIEKIEGLYQICVDENVSRIQEQIDKINAFQAPLYAEEEKKRDDYMAKIQQLQDQKKYTKAYGICEKVLEYLEQFPEYGYDAVQFCGIDASGYPDIKLKVTLKEGFQSDLTACPLLLKEGKGGTYRIIAINSVAFSEKDGLYLVEYTSAINSRNKAREVYLSCDNGEACLRGELSVCAEDLKKESPAPESLAAAAGSGVPDSEVENEVARIRAVYNEIVEERTNGQYSEVDLGNGVTAYTENGGVRCVIFPKGSGQMDYSRYYYFENEILIFAYIEGSDSHRLYFKDNQLFRWRYASDPADYSAAVNYDNLNSGEFNSWESFALREAYVY